MSDVFISYSKSDISRVEPLVRLLEEQGWSVWWDRTIAIGKTFDEVIEEALDAAICVVVVWTKDSVKSKWVKAEADEGARRNALVPVVLDNVKIPLEFRRIQSAHLSDWKGGLTDPEIIRFISSIAAILEKPLPDGDKSSGQSSTTIENSEDAKQQDPRHQRDSFSSNSRFKTGLLIASSIAFTVFLYWMLRIELSRDEEPIFVNSLLSPGVALTSGCVSLAIGTILHIRGKGHSKKIFWSIAATFLMIAGFLAWRDEHRPPNATPPNLACQIERVVVGQGPDTTLTQVFVLLSVRNVGVPSIAEKYRLHIKGHDIEYSDRATDIPEDYTLSPADKTPQLIFHLEDSLAEKTARPIERGGLNRGWLRFVIHMKDVTPDFISRPGTIYTVSLLDVSGKSSSDDYAIPMGMR
jgi:hypothetical protein